MHHCPLDRHGAALCLFVMLCSALPARSAPPFYPDKARLLILKDDQGKDHVIKTAEDWSKRRGHIAANMEEVMGPLPAAGSKVPLDVRYVEEKVFPLFVRKKLTFAVAQDDRVPAYLFLPRQEKAAKVPAVLCLHQTNGKAGCREPAGLQGNANLHYALHLAELGYVVLAPDYPGFGEYDYDFKKSPFASGTMKAVFNNTCAVDLLVSLPEVDGQKIGCIGHSLGGHNTMFTAAFDTRIKALVSNCGFNSFPKYYGGKIKGWSSDRYMPRLATVYDLKVDKVPFDFPDVVAALAPRAFLAIAPLGDSNFEVSGVKDCIAAALPVYELLGAKGKLEALYPDCKHEFPPDVRKTAYEWLGRSLKQEIKTPRG